SGSFSSGCADSDVPATVASCLAWMPPTFTGPPLRTQSAFFTLSHWHVFVPVVVTVRTHPQSAQALVVQSPPPVLASASSVAATGNDSPSGATPQPAIASPNATTASMFLIVKASVHAPCAAAVPRRQLRIR